MGYKLKLTKHRLYRNENTTAYFQPDGKNYGSFQEF
jgi:hypothetical protein